MLYERIRQLRETAHMSQSELAKKLDVTRSAVNAWEMGVSTPTLQYIVALSKLFHVSADYLVGTESEMRISLDTYSETEREVLYYLLKYFDGDK